VAGAINAVTKTAEPTAATHGNVLLSYGRFNTSHTAVGVTGPMSDSAWYRLDVSRSGSDGYVPAMDSSSLNLTGSVLWRPASRLRVKVSADYLNDELAKYFGTPLVPAGAAAEPLDVLRTTTGEVVDGRMRFVNYNVSDGVAEARQTLVRADVAWDLTGALTLRNVAYGFDADRRWKNAEGFGYCATTVDVCQVPGTVQRYYGYFIINHDQRLYGDRLTLTLSHRPGGRAHDAVVGVEASALDFERARGFRRQVPPAPGDAVDPFDPTPGEYGPVELRGISPTAVNTWGGVHRGFAGVDASHTAHRGPALRRVGARPAEPEPCARARGRRLHAVVHLVELAGRHGRQPAHRRRRLRPVQQCEGPGQFEHFPRQRQPELRSDRLDPMGSGREGRPEPRPNAAHPRLVRHHARRRA